MGCRGTGLTLEEENCFKVNRAGIKSDKKWDLLCQSVPGWVNLGALERLDSMVWVPKRSWGRLHPPSSQLGFG